MPTKPVPSNPNVPGSGTGGGLPLVTTNPVLPVHVPLLRTQKCTPKPVSWLTLAFRMVKLRVVGNACPPVLLVWKMKAKLNPAKILLFLRLALVPPMLKLVKELPVSTRPPVVLMPTSPPLIRREKPAFIVIDGGDVGINTT